MGSPDITIFYSASCPLCHKAIAFFESRNIPITKKQVQWDSQKDAWVEDENVRLMQERAGDVDFVPQIFIGQTHIAGWRKLEPMIESGDIDRLLKN